MTNEPKNPSMGNLTPSEAQSLIALLIARRLKFTATPYETNRVKRYSVEWEEKQ